MELPVYIQWIKSMLPTFDSKSQWPGNLHPCKSSQRDQRNL